VGKADANWQGRGEIALDACSLPLRRDRMTRRQPGPMYALLFLAARWPLAAHISNVVRDADAGVS
jgi:hypothetical protein